MAMRRQRIKAVANIQLNAKRKPKNLNDVKPNKNGESDNVNESQDEKKPEDLLENVEKTQTIAEEPKDVQSEIDVRPEIASDTKAIDYNLNVKNSDSSNKNNEDDHQNKVGEADVDMGNNEHNLSDLGKEINNALNDSEAFKCPPKVGYQRTISHTSNGGADDVFYSDIEENALQMDLQKSPNGFPMSPSKNQPRQRIRPTPHFGQRRNSFVGSGSSPHTAGHEDNQANNNECTQPSPTTRRERHLSGSLSNNSNSNTTSHQHQHHTPHKYLPVGITNGTTGRIRTESGCSVFSDTNTNNKSRKTDEHNSRQNSRREYEAFFVNGIPDKYALKMSDLIYWNPATNPMEQKPNPNVKQEAADLAAAKDVKLLVEKKEIDSDAPAAPAAASEAEAVPVPQLKLDSNGELILDDKSLVIETTAEQEARKVLANSSLIYLDENTGMNGFYSRQKRTREWPSSETIKFYRCLQNVGTDFSLMVSLFPNRTRRDLKLKFKKEERINGHLINKALLYPKQFNIESLKQQVEEEEKAREEEAKRLKSIKEKNKEMKKKKVTTSVANRVLANDDVYHNENSQKPKATRKRTNNKTKKANNAEITDPATEQDDTSAKPNENIKTEGVKRRRRRTPKIKEEVIIIKQEKIKKEKVITTTTPPPAPAVVYNDVKQLETEMNELLPPSLNAEHTSETLNTAAEPSLMPVTEEEEDDDVVEESSMTTESTQYIIDDDDDYYEENMDTTNEFENRTFVNLDDGSLNTYNKNINEETISSSFAASPPRSPSPESLEKPSTPSPYTSTTPLDIINSEDTCSSVMSERELNEQDIQQILTELAEGSLVLVSTLDPDDGDKVLNEIYMVDKHTGDICDEPLNIPDNIVQCILSVMS